MSEPSPASATYENFTDAAKSALLGTAQCVELSVFRQQNNVVFT